jgi:hypothetical protein
MLEVEPLMIETVFSDPADPVSVIEFTGQVWKSTGALLTCAADAEICVIPGVPAVACTWLLRSPLAALFNFTTEALAAVQLNGPTVDVTSMPRLSATAW